MKTHLIAGTACSLATFLGVSSAQAASVTYTDFSGDGGIPGLSVTINDHQNPGDLNFTLQVDTSQGYIADILGFYFDVANDSLVNGLSVVSGTDVTGELFSANSVSSVGGGNNMNGAGQGPYDAGFRFGDNGIGQGKGDYQLIHLRLTHSTLDLSVDDITRVGLRLQSVGEIDGGRGGSSKLFSIKPGDHVVPTPAAAGIGLVMLAGTVLRRKR